MKEYSEVAEKMFMAEDECDIDRENEEIMNHEKRLRLVPKPE